MKWLRLFQIPNPHHPVDEPQDVVTSREGVLDAYSDTWIFISNHLNSEIARLREANDSTKLTEIQTAALRGKIKMAREILDMSNKKERIRFRPSEDENE